MSDILTSLLRGAIFKRAALIEQWLEKHHSHGTQRIEIPYNDVSTQTVYCTCGESLAASLVVNTVLEKREA